MPKATIVNIPMAGQVRMMAELRRARCGYLLALHLLLLGPNPFQLTVLGLVSSFR